MKNKVLFLFTFFSLGTCLLIGSTPMFQEGFDSAIWKSRYNSSKVKVSYDHMKSEGHAAPGCAAITFLPGTIPGHAASLMHFIPVKTQYSYRISGWVKNSSSASVSLQAFDEKQKYLFVLHSIKCPAHMGWRQFTIDVSPEESVKQIRLLLSGIADSQGQGQILFDDITCSPVDAVEGISEDFTLNSWGLWRSKKAKVTSGHDVKEGHNAPGCMFYNIPSGGSITAGGNLLQRYHVTPGKEYNFLIWVKCINLSPDACVELGIQGQNEKNQFTGTGMKKSSLPVSACRNWKRLVLTYKIPVGGSWGKSSKVLITLGVAKSGGQPGKVYFDDFEMFIEE